jgi:hypothetical protein
MVMIGADELPEMDKRLQSLFQTLVQSKKTSDADKQASRLFLEWAIYPDWDSLKDVDVRPIQWSDGLHPSMRDRLVDIVRSAAAVARTGKDRDKADLVQACEEVLRARGVVFGDQTVAAKSAKVDKQTDARDKFVYQKVCKGTPAKQVLDLMSQVAHWELLPSEDEVFACAVRYAQRHSLPLPKK